VGKFSWLDCFKPDNTLVHPLPPSTATFSPLNFGVVTSVKDQGPDCGACWAEASTACLEARLNMAAKYYGGRTFDIDLSEQQLLNCAGNGCDGAQIWQGPDRLVHHGVQPDFLTRYVAARTPCTQWLAPNYQTASWGYVGKTVNSLCNAILTMGPIVAHMDVYDDFKAYGPDNPPYWHAWGVKVGGHEVLIVGFDLENQYFLCKNSWGSVCWDDTLKRYVSKWGDYGFFKISISEVFDSANSDFASEAIYFTDPWFEPFPFSLSSTTFAPKCSVGQYPSNDSFKIVPETGNTNTTPYFWYRIEVDQPWLKVEPTEGDFALPGPAIASDATIKVMYDTQTLPPGDYHGSIWVWGSASLDFPKRIIVNLTVYPPPTLGCDTTSLNNACPVGQNPPSQKFRIYRASCKIQ
jgi:hypothetical protein